MDSEHIYWLRELLTTNAVGHDEISMEFSFDNGMERAPHFFRVPSKDQSEARTLYQEWGGNRPPEYRVGTTVRGPGKPYARSIHLWRENE